MAVFFLILFAKTSKISNFNLKHTIDWRSLRRKTALRQFWLEAINKERQSAKNKNWKAIYQSFISFRNVWIINIQRFQIFKIQSSSDVKSDRRIWSSLEKGFKQEFEGRGIEKSDFTSELGSLWVVETPNWLILSMAALRGPSLVKE